MSIVTLHYPSTLMEPRRCVTPHLSCPGCGQWCSAMESGARALVTTHHTLSHSLALGESNNAQKWSVSVNTLQINFVVCIVFVSDSRQKLLFQIHILF